MPLRLGAQHKAQTSRTCAQPQGIISRHIVVQRRTPQQAENKYIDVS
jgi:hypothetical protein